MLDYFLSKTIVSFTCRGALGLSLCPQHDLEGMLDIDVDYVDDVFVLRLKFSIDLLFILSFSPLLIVPLVPIPLFLKKTYECYE